MWLPPRLVLRGHYLGRKRIDWASPQQGSGNAGAQSAMETDWSQDPPNHRPKDAPREDLGHGWAAFADALTNEHRVVVGHHGQLGHPGMALRLGIAGYSPLHRLVELLRSIDDDVRLVHGGLAIEMRLDSPPPEKGPGGLSAFTEWAFVSVEVHGDGGGAPGASLLAAMTKSAKLRSALERRTTRRLAVEGVGSPPPQSMFVCVMPASVRPLAIALLANRIAVVHATENQSGVSLVLATKEAYEMHWLTDALQRVEKVARARRSERSPLTTSIVWRPEHRTIPRRCLGWQEISVKLRLRQRRPGLRDPLLARAAEVVVCEGEREWRPLDGVQGPR
jgi:hypothetical protein